MYAVEIKKTHGAMREILAAALRGEEVVITQDDEAVAHLVAVQTLAKHLPVFGSARGLIQIADDFDDPLPEFEEYMS